MDRILIVLWIFWISLLLLGLSLVSGQPLEGFGTESPYGWNSPIYRVTHLRDGGPGSLRDAVSQGNRHIQFDVAGDINLASDLWIGGSHLTINGASAPPPGITIRGRGLVLHGTKGASDVLIRHLRLRQITGCDSCDSTGTGIAIGADATRIALDRVSIADYDDQAVSVNKGAQDITIQYSVFAEAKNASHNLPVLISSATSPSGRQTARVSVHHTLIIGGNERMPHVSLNLSGAQAAEITADVRNNLIVDWRGHAGTQVFRGAKANVVANYYLNPSRGNIEQQRGIWLCHDQSRPPQCDRSDPIQFARGFVWGNVSARSAALSAYLNSIGSEAQPFPAAPVTTTSACQAALLVLAHAGMRPLDARDAHVLQGIDLRGQHCPEGDAEVPVVSLPAPRAFEMLLRR